MSQHRWTMALLVVALTSSSVAFAIEGPSGDRDVSRGHNRDDRSFDGQYRSGGYSYQDDQMAARHQRARDDDAERRYSRDFDVQGKMNN